jgi:DNA end-binding protein Ku
MARPIWSGAISFGLVNVPVRLFAAVQPKDVRFHQLHAKDNARIQQRRICTADGEEVSYEDLVKGYEIATDTYVTVTNDELEGIAPRATKSIEIEEFVDESEIDPLIYDHSYLLVPSDGAAKPYVLLLEAMRDSGKVALGRVVLRTKQYLAAIRPSDDVLALSTMVFADEVIDMDDLDLAPRAGDRKELKMARSLVESLSGPFEPEEYHDDYRMRLLELIEGKAKGQVIVEDTEDEDEAPATEVVDLMAALEASLAAARPAGAKAAPKRGGRTAGKRGS